MIPVYALKRKPLLPQAPFICIHLIPQRTGVGHLGRRVAVEHLDQQRYDAFDYDGVGVGGELHFAVLKLCVEPHAALTTLYKVVGGLEALVDGWKLIAEIDDHGVAIHPVVDPFEVGCYPVLCLVDSHNVCFLSAKLCKKSGIYKWVPRLAEKIRSKRLGVTKKYR
jgi:hypothetical protein